MFFCLRTKVSSMKWITWARTTIRVKFRMAVEFPVLLYGPADDHWTA